MSKEKKARRQRSKREGKKELRYYMKGGRRKSEKGTLKQSQKP